MNSAITRANSTGVPVEAPDTSRVAIISLGHAVHDSYTSFLAPLLPVLTDKFLLSNSQAGLLQVFLQWPSVVQPLIGYLADRADLRYLVILAPTIAAIGMSLLAVAPTYAATTLLLIVVGFGAAALHAVGPAMAANLAGAQLGRVMGIWMVGGALGCTVGPLVIVATVSSFGINRTPYLLPAGVIASLVLYFRLRTYSAQPVRDAQSRPWRQAFMALKPLMIPVVGITFVRAFMMAALTTYLPLFLRSEGSDLWFAGAALAIFEAAGMAGSLFAGALSDRIGRRVILAAAMALTTPLMGVFVLSHGTARLPLLVALGLSANSIMPVMMAMMQEHFPQNRAMANGLYLGVNFLSYAGVTLLLGLLADASGLRTAFLVSTFVPLLSLPMIGWLPGRRSSPVL